MALDATAGGSASNSYITESGATAYFQNRLYTTAWTSADVPTREKALIWATALLDSMMSWKGVKQTEAQALRWPRAGVLDQDGYSINYLTIPLLLEQATATLALRLVESDRAKEPALLGLGFRSASLGPLSVQVDPLMVKGLVPDDVLVMLQPLGTIKGEVARGDRIVGVKRG